MATENTTLLGRDADPPYGPPSYSSDGVPEDFKYGVSLAQSTDDIRMAFVRKVYSILAVQIGLTLAFTCLAMFQKDVAFFVTHQVWLLVVAGVVSFISMLAIVIWKGRSYPANFYLLAIFTVCESYLIGAVVSTYDALMVLQAFIITFAMVVGLTLFTMQSKLKFEKMGPYLFVLLVVVLVAGILQIFFPFPSLLSLFLTVLCVILFSLYIVYDTNDMLKRMDVDDYVIGSIQLYLDIMNLFLNILRLLDYSNDWV